MHKCGWAAAASAAAAAAAVRGKGRMESLLERQPRMGGPEGVPEGLSE